MHTLQSVSKSFASALVGIAIARGEFKSVEEKVLDFFPEMKGIANMDERKAAMRLEDILTMRTGTDYHENGAGLAARTAEPAGHGLGQVLSRPADGPPPGTGFQYDSGGVILISAMLKSRTGLHAQEYAERTFSSRSGSRRYTGSRNAEGHTHTGGGLGLSARDAAKLGQLYLNNGRWGDVQVVPEAGCGSPSGCTWISRSPASRLGIRLLWWIWRARSARKDRENIVYAARGRFGQYIIVVPEHDMVVVFLGDAKDRPEMGKPIEVFYDRVLTTVRR